MAGPGTKRVASGFPGFRLFIFGVDVTDEVASYTTSWDDGRQPSTMVFTLADKNGRFTIDPSDMEALYPTINLSDIDDPIIKSALERAKSLDAEGRPQEALALLSGVAGQQIQQFALGRTRDAIFNGVADPVKSAVLAAKAASVLAADRPFGGVSFGGDAARLINGSAGGADIAALTGRPLRYPFAPSKCIFHPNDPVRLFERDATTGRWFYGFSGFGTTFSRQRSANGMRSWTITCEDPLRIARRSRIALNAGIADPEVVIKGADAALRNFHSEGLVGASLPEYVMTMFFGADAVKAASTQLGSSISATRPPVNLRAGVNGASTTERVNELGTGYFNFDDSRVYLFGPAPEGSSEVSEAWPAGLADKVVKDEDATLNAWQVDVDHAVRLPDLGEMIVPERQGDLASYVQGCIRYTVDDLGRTVTTVDAEKLISTIGANPQVFPVDRGRVMMLMPRSLGAAGASDVLLRDLLQGPPMLTAWKTRLGLMYDVVQRLDMSLYATPKGDIVIEMPLYDYDPESFDDVIDTSFVGSTGASSLNEKTPENFSSRYRWAIEDTVDVNDTHNDEGVRTVVRCTYNLIPNYAGTGTSELIGAAALAYAAHLIPQYGLRMEEVSPRAQTASPAAAEALAHLTLNKLNADAESMSVSVFPALGVGPNRPQYFDESTSIGTCRSIQRAVTWGVSGNMSMRLNVNYVRRWNGHLRREDGSPLFSTIAGFGGRPFNWALLFSAPSAKAAESAPAPNEPNQSLPGEAGTVAAAAHAHEAEEDDARAKAAKVRYYAQSVMLPWLATNGTPSYITSSFRTLEQDRELQRQGRFVASRDMARFPSEHQHGLAIDFGGRQTPPAQLKTAIDLFINGPGPNTVGPGHGRVKKTLQLSDHVHVDFIDPSKWPG